jgi:hypothetical protein
MTAHQMIDAAFQMTGPELCSLMRKHRVTIRDLKTRTGITMKRIRERRESGLGGHAAIDWHEAITGSLTPRMRAALKSAYNG